MSITQPTRSQIPCIGLTKIWAEGQGVDRVSRRAVVTHVIRRAFENIARSPVTASLTVVTITIALFLLGIFLLVVENTHIAVSTSGGSLTTYIFIKDSVSADQIASIKTDLQSLPNLSSGNQKIRFVDKQRALDTFRKILGDEAEILDGLEDENPLPVSLEITSESAVHAEEVFSWVSKKFSEDERIESVKYSQGTVQQLRRLMRVVEVGGGVGVIFLLLITGFIIANTIKLALFSHRTEVEIMQLVGARRSAIFAPYMLEGGLQGLAGSIVAIILVSGAFLFFRDVVNQAEALSFIFPQFHFLSYTSVACMVMLGIFVGMGGSILAVRRFLLEGT